MIEQTLERIAVALEKIAENTQPSSIVQVDMGKPVVMDPEHEIQVVVAPEKKKTKKAKKKAAPVEKKVEEKTMEAGATNVSYTKEDLKKALMDCVVANGGEDDAARAIMDGAQDGATMSTLDEGLYETVISQLKEATGE